MTSDRNLIRIINIYFDYTFRFTKAFLRLHFILHETEFTRLLISRFRKLLDSATVPAVESRELNTKLINPKECLDFLGRCCYGGGEDRGRSRRGRQSIPILECASLEDAAPHLYVFAGSYNIYVYTSIRTYT